MKKSIILAASAAALATLAACNTEPEVVQINEFDPMAEQLKNAGNVAPPPMIQVTRAYRCRDNSLVYVDFYTNNTATVRTSRDGLPVATLTAEGGNPPYRAEGYSVSANADEISYTSPAGTKSCHV